MMKSLSVVIPNYNGERLLKAYLPSVFCAIERAGVDSEVIIVDDCSSDRSVALIQREFPQVKLFVNEKNLGFGSTCNRGFAEATKEVVLCLNNDMELREDFLVEQLPLLEQGDVFAVMCRIMSGDKQRVLESCKRIRGNSISFRLYDMPEAQMGFDTAETFYACGGNALYDREKLMLLGGFSPLLHPFYFEDVDLSLRAWRMGWRSIYCRTTECYHQHSATIASLHRKQAIAEAVFLNFLKMTYYHFIPERRTRMVRIVRGLRLSYALQATIFWKKRAKLRATTTFLKMLGQEKDLRMLEDQRFAYRYTLDEVLVRLGIDNPL